MIILQIVGNAAEHASAIMFALKDKLVSCKILYAAVDPIASSVPMWYFFRLDDKILRW